MPRPSRKAEEKHVIVQWVTANGIFEGGIFHMRCALTRLPREETWVESFDVSHVEVDRK